VTKKTNKPIVKISDINFDLIGKSAAIY
jgi:hypothetical protein